MVISTVVSTATDDGPYWYSMVALHRDSITQNIVYINITSCAGIFSVIRTLMLVHDIDGLQYEDL